MRDTVRTRVQVVLAWGTTQALIVMSCNQLVTVEGSLCCNIGLGVCNLFINARVLDQVMASWSTVWIAAARSRFQGAGYFSRQPHTQLVLGLGVPSQPKLAIPSPPSFQIGYCTYIHTNPHQLNFLCSEE
jgi:hypothetical protein